MLKASNSFENVTDTRSTGSLRVALTRGDDIRTIMHTNIPREHVRALSGAGDEPVHAHIRLPHFPVSIEHERKRPRA